MCALVCVYACVWRTEVNLSCHSQGVIYLVFSGRVSRWDLGLDNQAILEGRALLSPHPWYKGPKCICVPLCLTQWSADDGSLCCAPSSLPTEPSAPLVSVGMVCGDEELTRALSMPGKGSTAKLHSQPCFESFYFVFMKWSVTTMNNIHQ